MTNINRTVISRRSRPSKAPLSKELIMNTALELLKNEGSSGLSMRKIAKVLDTGPSSLYVYYTSLNELSAYVLDHGLENIVIPDLQAGDWKKKLFELLKSYLTILYESPGLAELSQTTIPLGPNYLAITEFILQLLNEGGIHSTKAAWGVDLLLFYASSVAFEQASRDQKGTTLNGITNVIQSINPEQYPFIFSMKEDLVSRGEERFNWGLEVILNGILYSPDPE